MANRYSHRVQVLFGWDMPEGNPLAKITQHGVLARTVDIKRVLDESYVAGGARARTIHSTPTSYHAEVRIHHKGSVGRRKTNWNDIFRYLWLMNNCIQSLPAECKAYIKIDMQAGHMPWTFITDTARDQFSLFLREGAEQYRVKTDSLLKIDDSVAKFNNMLCGRELRKTYVESNDFYLFGRPEAVQRFRRVLRVLDRSASWRRKLNPLDEATGTNGFPLDDQLLVLYRNAEGQYRPIPGLGNRIMEGGFATAAFRGQLPIGCDVPVYTEMQIND